MRKGSTTVRMLALFALVLLVFSLAFAYVHARVTRELTDGEISRAQRLMARGCGAVSESILSAYRMMGALSSYATVQTLATAQTLQPIHFAQILKLQNELGRAFSSEEWLLRVQVFFDTDQGVAVSANGALHDARAAYQDGRLAVGGLSYDAFCQLLRGTRNRKLQIREFAGSYALTAPGLFAKDQTNAVVIALKLAVPSSRSDAYAIAWLDVDALRDSIAGDEPVSDLFALFSGERPLYASRALPPDTSPLAPRQYHPAFETTTLSMQVQGTPLYGVLELPNAVIAEKIVALTSLLYVLLSVFVASCLGLFGMLLLTILRPLHRLTRRISGDAPFAGGNVFAQIHRHLDDADAKALQSALQQLLLGLSQDGEVRAVVRALSGQEAGNRWYVWILGGPADDPRAWIPVRQAIAAQFRQVITVSIDNASLVGLVCLPAGEARQLPALCNQLLARMKAQDSAGSRFAMGVCREGVELPNLHAAFVEAQRALRLAVWWQAPDVVCVEDWTAAPEYRLTYAELEQLSNLVLAGNGAQAAEALERFATRLFGATYKDRKPSFVYRQFQHDILGALLRIGEHSDLFATVLPLLEAEERPDLPSFLSQIRESLLYAAEQMAIQRQDQAAALSQRMADYLKAHYAQADMSLRMLADQFHLSEQHCSAFFKDKIGTNFSTYLETLRLSQAKLLLRAGRPVREVSGLVGYASPNTFAKAFKRRLGMAPSEWLDMRQWAEQ